ncbi:hypothetical protein [Aestuariivirga sp.]|uniref:hypothetical protein n=1 Tax=Aestuariivirga sp. TaxID=2650926 RepID=UPI0039E482E0
MGGLLGLLMNGSDAFGGGGNGFISPDDLDRRKEAAQRLMQSAGLIPMMMGYAAMNRVNGDETRMRTGASRDFSNAFWGNVLAPGASRETASAPASVPANVKDGIVQTANALGISPVDLATAISYETAGTFDPTKAGPTTKWGQHKGLIQFGQPQAQQYGVDWNNPVGSQLGANGAVAKYLTDAGVKPGMGLMDIYSAINAGKVGRYGASDAAAGGAPGTVADKVNNQMAAHRAKAMALLAQNGAPTVQPAADTPATAQPPMGLSFNGAAAVAPPAQQPVPQPQVIPAAAPPMQQPVQQRPMTAFQRLNMTAAAKDGGAIDPRNRAVLQGGSVTQGGGWNPFAPRMAQPPIQQPMPAGGPSLPQQTGIAQDGGTAPAGNDRLAVLQQTISSPNFVWMPPAQQKMILDAFQQEYARANPSEADKVDLAIKQAQLEKLQHPDTSLVNAGDGRLYDPKAGKWIVAPDSGNTRQPSSVQEYEYYSAQEKAAGRQPVDYGTWEKSKTPVTNISVGAGSGVKEDKIFDETKARADAARVAASGYRALENAERALDGGIITGQFANQQLALQKIAAYFGADPSAVTNTETFRAAIAPQVAALLKSTVGSTQISDADREFAEKAAGGSITLDESSIRRLIHIGKVANAEIARGFNADLNRVYPEGQEGNDRVRALFDIPNVPATYMTPQGPDRPAGNRPSAGQYSAEQIEGTRRSRMLKSDEEAVRWLTSHGIAPGGKGPTVINGYTIQKVSP